MTPSIPADADRDFTASAFVIDDGQILLIKHTKLGVWLQPGGHIEPQETPPETARRETREETGIEIDIHPRFEPDWDPADSYNLAQPFTTNLHRIREGHWHCDFGFLATIDAEVDATHAHEHDGIAWIGKEELSDYEMHEQTRNAANRAIDIITDTDG